MRRSNELGSEIYGKQTNHLNPSVVCERHFEKHLIVTDFVHIIDGKEVRVPRGKPTLAPNAVPTILPDMPACLSKKRRLQGRKENDSNHPLTVTPRRNAA